MKISVNTADLKSALKNAARVTDPRNTIPILSHVMLELEPAGLRISATDLEISRQEFLPYTSPLEQPADSCANLAGWLTEALWRRAVDCKALLALLPTTAKRIKLAPTVELYANDADDDSTIEVDVGGSESTLRTLPAEDFPTLAFDIPKWKCTGPAPDPAVIGGEEFRTTAKKVFSAISAEDSRFQLAGALFELREDGLRMVATDGHRLHRAETEWRVAPCHILRLPEDTKDPGILVPRKVLAAMLADSTFGPVKRRVKVGVYKVGSRKGRDKMQAATVWPGVYYTATDHHVHFESSRGARYVARILDGAFPDYKRVIKEDSPDLTITTTAEDLRQAIASVEHMTGDRARAIRLDTSGDLPVFSAKDPDKGTAESTLNGRTSMSGQMSGDQKPEDRVESIGVNPDYVMQAMKPFSGDSEISILLWDQNTQFLLKTSEDPAFRAVVMPIRI